MNLKPFNLSEFQAGAVAVTRDGRIACLQISYTEGEGLEAEPQSKEG